MACQDIQERMAALLMAPEAARDRLEVEAHALRCARCAQAFGELAQVAVSLDRAYGPLRSASVSLSPARVRLALRAPERLPFAIRAERVTRRLSEVALAAAVTAVAFVGSGSVAPTPAIVEESAARAVPPVHVTARPDDQTFIRWFQIGRYAVSADLLDPAAAPLRDEEDTTAGAITRDRPGVAR